MPRTFALSPDFSAARGLHNRRNMRISMILLGAALALSTSPALAEEPPERTSAPEPAVRSEGIRAGIDLGFARASGEAADRLNQGSPSLIPFGAELSFRTSAKVLLGFHGHLGLASRSDCLGQSDCTARGYGLGTHVEAAFSAGKTFVPYIRYGIGWEMLHQSGAYNNAGAYTYRHALDLVDLRFGGDFRLSEREGGRTTRLGPFIGMIAGLALDEVSGGHTSSRAPEFGAGHIWYVVGARATIDP
jgi:hypothetical protein